MIQTTLFITEAYIRSNTQINRNVSATDIVSSVSSAQELHIQPILGTEFYVELLGKYSGQTLSPDEEILLGFIQPCLAHYSTSMLLPFLNTPITAKGQQLMSGDWSTNAEQSQMEYLRSQINNSAEFYETRLKKYLCDNKALFSGYTSNDNQTTDVIPSQDTNGYSKSLGMFEYRNSSTRYNRYGYNPYI